MDLITLVNKDSQKIITDIVIHPYEIKTQESGVLVETLRRDWDDVFSNDLRFFTQYYQEVGSGIALDEDVWHYHPNVQYDRFSVVKGEVVVAVSDNRYDSSTRGLLNLFYISARENPYILLVPRKTLHSLLVVSKEPAIIINFPTALYNPKEEERIPFSQAKVNLSEGIPFNWDLVRKDFNISPS